MGNSCDLDARIGPKGRQQGGLDDKIGLKGVDLDRKIGLKGRRQVDLDSKIGLKGLGDSFARLDDSLVGPDDSFVA